MAFCIRFAEKGDVPAILRFIKELAEYERLSEYVVATEELLCEWLFEKGAAEVLIGELNREAIGFALYFHSFSTFQGRAGIYLEDLYVVPNARGNGYGKAMLKRLAEITVERGCGRLEWSCLDWNAPSIEFYRSLGAEPLSDWTRHRLSGETLKKLANHNKEDISK